MFVKIFCEYSVRQNVQDGETVPRMEPLCTEKNVNFDKVFDF